MNQMNSLRGLSAAAFLASVVIGLTAPCQASCVIRSDALAVCLQSEMTGVIEIEVDDLQVLLVGMSTGLGKDVCIRLRPRPRPKTVVTFVRGFRPTFGVTTNVVNGCGCHSVKG